MIGGAGDEEMEAQEEESAEEDDVFDQVDVEKTSAHTLPSPQRPTAKEVEEHNATHLPYRSWRPVCVQSRGRGNSHKKM